MCLNYQGAIRCSKTETGHAYSEYGFHRRDVLKCIGATVGMVRANSFYICNPIMNFL